MGLVEIMQTFSTKINFLDGRSWKEIMIFKNPSTRMINKILVESSTKSIRFGLTSSEEPDLYVWDGEVYHYTVLSFLEEHNIAVGADYQKGNNFSVYS